MTIKKKEHYQGKRHERSARKLTLLSNEEDTTRIPFTSLGLETETHDTKLLDCQLMEMDITKSSPVNTTETLFHSDLPLDTSQELITSPSSTTSPLLKPPFRLAMWDFDHCDPKRCSGKKLARYGLIQSLKFNQKFPGIILSPQGTRLISKSDLQLVMKKGLCVFECSWARLEDIPFHKWKSSFERQRNEKKKKYEDGFY
ncbi:ribosome biogenesis protein tsr3 [Coelomomyces lativittatus]|nr:ribosome biogenesis protein tsr3 [Coelomomyces lativittatus]